MPLFTSFTRHTDSAKTKAQVKPSIITDVTPQVAVSEKQADTAADQVCEACAKELDKDIPAPISPTTGIRARDADAKAVRAYEVERNRVKRTAERARVRERKAGKCRCCSPVRSRGPGRGAARVQWEGRGGEHDPAAEDEEPRVGGIRDALSTVAPGHWAREVLLQDLVGQAKFRKGKAGDFELIPHVRSVIVLEDHDFEEPNEDEAWEHVSGDDEDDTSSVKAPSYAEVVSSTK
ncbi:hypothetical protein BD410DRAFT_899208 [Rickenella mellea]|uniref:Uncharacterized protein n=1 Tax=Rickenella mellea TaxID=50990 RepID=A0A4Y7Q122_9AGAM|nr:hypothetical protein BD410DRAFT_899208 [Rickenella mellea]